MKHISNFLSQSLNRSGFKKQVQTALVIEDLEALLLEVFGPEISLKIKPLYIKNNTITIACLSSAMSQEFNFHKTEIINKLNKKYNSELISDIRVVL